MNKDKIRAITMTVPWNLFLLTISGFVTSFVLCSIARPQGFVSGGLYGLAMLIVYATDTGSIGLWYALTNIPTLIVGWFGLSRRFMLYTMYCIIATTLFTEFVPWVPIIIEDKMLAAIAVGIGCGIGSSFAIRSLGSDGGINIFALLFHSKYNFSVGTTGIIFNSILFLAAAPIIKIDNTLYSIIIAYFTSTIMNYSMTMFDKRKMVIIISSFHENIAQTIMDKLGRGCTALQGTGLYTGIPREVLLTVIPDIQLKRLEEIVYEQDHDAMMIVENTNMVLGKGFSSRKVY